MPDELDVREYWLFFARDSKENFTGIVIQTSAHIDRVSQNWGAPDVMHDKAAFPTFRVTSHGISVSTQMKEREIFMRSYTFRAALHDARVFYQLCLEHRQVKKNRHKPNTMIAPSSVSALSTGRRSILDRIRNQITVHKRRTQR